MLFYTVLLVLQLTLLVQSTVLATPASESTDLDTDTDAQMNINEAVEKIMNKLVLKHKKNLESRAGHVNRANIQTGLQSEGKFIAQNLGESQNPRFTNDLRLHMIPIMDKDIKSIKQRLRRKYSEDIVSALGTGDSSNVDRKAVLLYYSNE